MHADPRRTLLAIDDDPVVLDLVKAMLESEGWTVLSAADGETGMALARRGASVVLLDLLMPGMDGFDVVEALRGDPATSAIPIVVLTSKSMTRADRTGCARRISYVAQKGASAGPTSSASCANERPSAGGRGHRRHGERRPDPRGRGQQANPKLRVLRFAGYDVVEARSGSRVSSCERCAPDLVLMDLQLPNMDGTRRCGCCAQAAAPGGARGGHGLHHEGRPRRTLRAGFDGLEKPISVRALPEQVRGFLAGEEPPDGR